MPLPLPAVGALVVSFPVEYFENKGEKRKLPRILYSKEVEENQPSWTKAMDCIRVSSLQNSDQIFRNLHLACYSHSLLLHLMFIFLSRLLIKGLVRRQKIRGS